MGFVYKIINMVDGKIYIGSTNYINKRWKHHMSSLRHNKHRNPYLQKAWNKYGENSFKIEVLEECIDAKKLEIEQYYIDTNKPEYNLCPIAGCPSKQQLLTEEHKTKIAKTKKGKPLSDIHKKRLSESLKGRKLSEEDKLKKSLALKGKAKPPRSKEHCINMSKAKMGKKHSLETRIKMSLSHKKRLSKEVPNV